MCVALLIAPALAQSLRPQETTSAPPQSAATPPAQEKPRSEKETRKRLEQLACGPPHVHFSHHVDNGPQALPEQPADKGLIYIIRPRTYFGAAGQAKIAMDGKWVGTNRIGNYFYIEVDPGPHYFCMKEIMQEPALLSLVVERGKTYYLRHGFTMGGIDLDLVEEEKGKEYLAKYHRSVFEEKHKK